MTTAMQLFAIFAFGLVITGIVLLGIMRAREAEKTAARVRSVAASDERPR